MGARRVRHESALGKWEMVWGAPHPSLRTHVRDYIGWFEHFAVPLCRREVPTEDIPVIINFRSQVRLFDMQDPSRWTDYNSFTTGAVIKITAKKYAYFKPGKTLRERVSK